jgi:hypothetical protein
MNAFARTLGIVAAYQSVANKLLALGLIGEKSPTSEIEQAISAMSLHYIEHSPAQVARIKRQAHKASHNVKRHTAQHERLCNIIIEQGGTAKSFDDVAEYVKRARTAPISQERLTGIVRRLIDANLVHGADTALNHLSTGVDRLLSERQFGKDVEAKLTELNKRQADSFKELAEVLELTPDQQNIDGIIAAVRIMKAAHGQVASVNEQLRELQNGVFAVRTQLLKADVVGVPTNTNLETVQVGVNNLLSNLDVAKARQRQANVGRQILDKLVAANVLHRDSDLELVDAVPAIEKLIKKADKQQRKFGAEFALSVNRMLVDAKLVSPVAGNYEVHKAAIATLIANQNGAGSQLGFWHNLLGTMKANGIDVGARPFDASGRAAVLDNLSKAIGSLRATAEASDSLRDAIIDIANTADYKVDGTAVDIRGLKAHIKASIAAGTGSVVTMEFFRQLCKAANSEQNSSMLLARVKYLTNQVALQGGLVLTHDTMSKLQANANIGGKLKRMLALATPELGSVEGSSLEVTTRLTHLIDLARAGKDGSKKVAAYDYAAESLSRLATQLGLPATASRTDFENRLQGLVVHEQKAKHFDAIANTLAERLPYFGAKDEALLEYVVDQKIAFLLDALTELQSVEATLKESGIEELANCGLNLADGAKWLLGDYKKAKTELAEVAKANVDWFQKSLNHANEIGVVRERADKDVSNLRHALDSITFALGVGAHEVIGLDEVLARISKMTDRPFSPSDERRVVKILGDVASVFGRNIVDVAEALASAVQGSPERLKEYGVNLENAGKVASLTAALTKVKLVAGLDTGATDDVLMHKVDGLRAGWRTLHTLLERYVDPFTCNPKNIIEQVSRVLEDADNSLKNGRKLTRMLRAHGIDASGFDAEQMHNTIEAALQFRTQAGKAVESIGFPASVNSVQLICQAYAKTPQGGPVDLMADLVGILKKYGQETDGYINVMYAIDDAVKNSGKDRPLADELRAVATEYGATFGECVSWSAVFRRAFDFRHKVIEAMLGETKGKDTFGALNKVLTEVKVLKSAKAAADELFLQLNAKGNDAVAGLCDELAKALGETGVCAFKKDYLIQQVRNLVHAHELCGKELESTINDLVKTKAELGTVRNNIKLDNWIAKRAVDKLSLQQDAAGVPDRDTPFARFIHTGGKQAGLYEAAKYIRETSTFEAEAGRRKRGNMLTLLANELERLARLKETEAQKILTTEIRPAQSPMSKIKEAVGMVSEMTFTVKEKFDNLTDAMQDMSRNVSMPSEHVWGHAVDFNVGAPSVHAVMSNGPDRLLSKQEAKDILSRILKDLEAEGIK